MKKSFFYLLVFALSFGLTTSCSSDDNGSGDSPSAIVGKWKLTQVGMLTETGEEYLVPAPGPCNGKNFYELEFSSDGTVRVEEHDDDCVLKVSVGSYWIEGDVISIFGGAEGGSGTIKELTSTTLKIYWHEEDEDMVPILVLTRI